MLFFALRRASQLTMARKFTGREAVASAALKIRDEEQLRNFGGFAKTPNLTADNADNTDLHGSKRVQ